MKTVIHTKTKEEFKKVLEIFENKGWRWCDEKKPLEVVNQWDSEKEDTCIEYQDNFAYDSKNWYKDNGYKIISFRKFLKQEGIGYAPTEEEIRQEMILNFKEQMK